MEYDLDSKPVDRQSRALFLERFIHGETYRARSDVMAVIHSHSPTVIPFSISQTPLQPVFNGAAFLSPSAPVFDIRKVAGMTDLLISNGELGKALSETLGKGAVVLLRATVTSWSEKPCSKLSTGPSKLNSMPACSFKRS